MSEKQIEFLEFLKKRAVTQYFACVSGDATQMIPLIYKNDSTEVSLLSEFMLFEDLLFIACNAKELSMYQQLVKYENGEILQLEAIVEHLPKLESLTFTPCSDVGDVNGNTVRKFMKIEHFKNLSTLKLRDVSETLDVEEMFNLILENRHVSVFLFYRKEISDADKERVREYSNLLKKENGCNSRIGIFGIDCGPFGELATSEDDNSDTSVGSFDDNISDVDENEDLMFPWNMEENEEWGLPWDKE